MQDNTQLSAATEIELARPGKLLRGRDIRLLSLLGNSLLKMQVKRSDALPDGEGIYRKGGSVKISDRNITIELLDAPDGVQPSGSSGIVPMQVVSTPSGSNEYFSAKLGSFTAADTFTATGSAINVALPWELRPSQSPGSGYNIFPAYAVNDVFWALQTAAGDNGVYVSSAELLYMDLGLNRAWAPASGIQPFYFVQSWGDYIIGANISTGTHVQIAKAYKLRNSITSEYEAADSITWSYTYQTTGALAYISRAKADGTTYTENQRVTPSYLAAHSPLSADIIYAIQISNTGVVSQSGDTLTPTGTAITWIDLNLDGRAWAATPDGKP